MSTLSNQVIVVMVTEARVGAVADVLHYQLVVMLARNWPLWQFVVYSFTWILSCMFVNQSFSCLPQYYRELWTLRLCSLTLSLIFFKSFL